MATRLAAVVDASAEVAATRARSAKVEILADLLRNAGPGEVAVCVGLLSGTPRQGRVGVGYATVYGIDVPPAAEPSLTVADVDRAIDEIAADGGPGSATRRRQLLTELLGRATEPEAEFVRRLLTGGLRQGALAGVMADAVGKAAGVSAVLARRALMLSGDLTRMAEIAITGGDEGLRAVGLELFRPVLPMLASPGAGIAEAMAG
ncbi:MAG: ligase 1, partial [Solirubrobacteraceae bacterium]|nr:ligase 1 [Solirubrobacteraceae bacterium]